LEAKRPTKRIIFCRVENVRIDGKPAQRHIAYPGGFTESAVPYGQNIDPRLRFKELKRVDCCPGRSWFYRPTAQAMFGDTWAFTSIARMSLG
jgi:hypothetical protein